MAEEKTKKVFVRLTRDFPVGATHRRGGIALTAGPQPVEAEVTAEQLTALENDHMVEIVSAKEAKKWEERLGQPDAPTSAELAEDSDSSSTGRNYDGDDNTNSGSENGSDDGSNGSDEGNDAPEFTPETPLKDLQAEATRLGVEDADKLRSKQAAYDAIEAKKAETNTGSDSSENEQE